MDSFSISIASQASLPPLQPSPHRAPHVDVLPQPHVLVAQVPENTACEGPGGLNGEGLGLPEHGGVLPGEEGDLAGGAAGSGRVLK